MWETAKNFVGSEVFQVLLLAVIAWVQSSKWYKQSRRVKAWDIVLAATLEVYRNFVRPAKENHGKLREAERRQAMYRAVSKAVEHARASGIDLLKLYGGRSGVATQVEAAVSILKGGKHSSGLAIDPSVDSAG